MIVTDKEAEELVKQEPAPVVSLPVGEQVAVLAVATVLSAAVLFVLGTQPTLNGLLVGALVILGVIIVSRDE